jgi:hypothetical protein
MTQRLKVTSIALTTADGKRVELTIAEARDLHDQLAEMFGPKIVNTPIVIERDQWPRPWFPYQPMWVSDRSTDVPPRPTYITCSAPSGLRTDFLGVDA